MLENKADLERTGLPTFWTERVSLWRKQQESRVIGRPEDCGQKFTGAPTAQPGLRNERSDDLVFPLTVFCY